MPRSSGAGILGCVDLLATDPVTGRRTGLPKTVRRAIRAVEGAGVPYAVIGATALAARGLPRMTRDLDLVVLVDDGATAIEALRKAGLRAETPTGPPDSPESMVVFVDPATDVEVDLLVAAGDPEATVIDEAPRARVMGVDASVATLEHLLLCYLYSNEPKHLGDFASIVRSGKADLARAERALRDMHAEMLPEWKRRVLWSRSPPPPPARPPARRRRS